ncbi:MAG TPA: O-antigen ligase family protein [Candidatus Cybelea sp.]|jgi:O-antigen ligase|nr:O-antigen ligase family protein [Candidatus Cybelea sp.]
MLITRTPHRAALTLLAIGASAIAIIALLLAAGIGPAAVVLAALVMAPLGLYVALNRPLDVPLGFYVLLIPFDNLLGTGSFGTLTKFLGIVSGVFLLLWVAQRRRFMAIGAPVVVLVGLIVWMLASTLWSVDQSLALKIIPTYAGLMLLYIVLTMMPVSPAQFERLLLVVVAGGLCAAAYGIHLFYNQPVMPQTPAVQRLVVQVGENFIDPNHFADAMLFPVAILVMWGLRCRMLLGKAACAGGLAAFVVAILLSGSREALTALFVIAAYYIWRSRYRLQAIVALVVPLIGAVAGAPALLERFSTILQTGGSGRASIWAVALEAAKHRALQGYGIGNFTEAFNQFYLGVHQPYPYGWDSPAHSLVMHYLVELGVVGLALVAAFFVAQFRSLRIIDRTSDLYDSRLMMEAALVATAGVSLTIDLFTYKYAWLVFSMVALLRNAAAYRAPQAADSSNELLHDPSAIGASLQAGSA